MADGFENCQLAALFSTASVAPAVVSPDLLRDSVVLACCFAVSRNSVCLYRSTPGCRGCSTVTMPPRSRPFSEVLSLCSEPSIIVSVIASVVISAEVLLVVASVDWKMALAHPSVAQAVHLAPQCCLARADRQ